MRAEDHGAVY